ncbi:hypothetical protein D3C80_1507800 [compost metagenome]
MAFLAVIKHVITVLADFFQREHVVMHLGFLQTNYVRLVLFDNGGKLMRTCAQSVDIKGDELHSREPFGDEIRRAIVAEKGRSEKPASACCGQQKSL